MCRHITTELQKYIEEKVIVLTNPQLQQDREVSIEGPDSNIKHIDIIDIYRTLHFTLQNTFFSSVYRTSTKRDDIMTINQISTDLKE